MVTMSPAGNDAIFSSFVVDFGDVDVDDMDTDWISGNNDVAPFNVLVANVAVMKELEFFAISQAINLMGGFRFFGR